MSNLIRVTVTDDQGTLLDTVTLTREEFQAAQDIGIEAVALLGGLQIGS